MNKDWINRTVNTRGMRCPYAKRVCPGTREGKGGCALWITETLANDEGSQDIQSGCMIAFQYVLQNSQQVEAIRLNKGMDKVANVTGSGSNRLSLDMRAVSVLVAQAIRHQDLLASPNDNESEDKEDA